MGSGLRGDVKDALGRGLVRSGDLDGAVVMVESMEEAQEALVRYRARLRDSGYLWLITRKRGHDSYLNQMTPGALRQARRPDRQQDLLDRRATGPGSASWCRALAARRRHKQVA